MTRFFLPIILLFALGGCASLRSGDGGVVQRFSQSRKLAGAKELLESGDRVEAAKALTAVIAAGDIPGITDEALFRLALLGLRPSLERDNNLQALQLLKRLKKEYPASPWTAQSAQLTELLSGLEEVRRQIRNLKSHNQSLSNEVNELNRSIDQLKQLDQELEKKRH